METQSTAVVDVPAIETSEGSIAAFAPSCSCDGLGGTADAEGAKVVGIGVAVEVAAALVVADHNIAAMGWAAAHDEARRTDCWRDVTYTPAGFADRDIRPSLEALGRLVEGVEEPGSSLVFACYSSTLGGSLSGVGGWTVDGETEPRSPVEMRTARVLCGNNLAESACAGEGYDPVAWDPREVECPYHHRHRHPNPAGQQSPPVLCVHELLHTFARQHRKPITYKQRRDTHILKSTNGLVDIARREIIQLFIMAKNDDGNIDGTEDGKLMRFLEQASFALQKGSK